MKYTVFDSFGELGRYINCPPEYIDAQLTSGEGYVDGYFAPEVYYIPDIEAPIATNKLINTTLIDKTTATADGVDKITLSNVPIGADVSITGPVIISGVADDSTVELFFDIAGEYKVTVDLFPYLPFEVTINAA